MTSKYEDFLNKSLGEMNFVLDGVNSDTPLGQDGLDVDSLAASELAMRVRDDFNITLAPELIMRMPELTFGELAAMLADQIDDSAL